MKQTKTFHDSQKENAEKKNLKKAKYKKNTKNNQKNKRKGVLKIFNKK